MKLAFVLTTLFLGTCGASAAQEALCVQNDAWLAISLDQADYAGQHMLARPAAKGKTKCEYAQKHGDYIINPDGEPLWFETLVGNYLTTFRSTGPDGNIVIFDLAGQTSVVDVPADSDVLSDESSIIYWERTTLGTKDNCPEYAEYTANGLGAIIAEERILDATTGDITATGEQRCSATQ